MKWKKKKNPSRLRNNIQEEVIGGRIKNFFYADHKEGHQPWVIEEVSEAKQVNNLFHIFVFSLSTADLIETFLGPENSQKKSLLFHLLWHVS